VQETGRTKASIFAEHGVTFTKTSNDRETGWLAVKELLAVRDTGAALQIFSSCTELIRCLPQLTVDKVRPTDCANEPHEITHAPDALRGFAIFYARPAREERVFAKRIWTRDMWEDFNTATEDEKKYLKNKYGEPE
jgi:phage terminase large subunit